MTRKKKTEAAEEVVTSFKGFNQDLTCRGYQFEIGKTYEHKGEVEACASGFHACEYPLDIFGYYRPAGSRFALVEQSGDLSRHDDDSKVASRKISIKAELTIAGLVKAAIEYTTSRCTPVDPESPASSTGDYGAASSTGYQGAASSTGTRGAASSTGDYGAASSTGNRGAASSTGKHSVAMAAGIEGKAKASAGSAIVLCYRDTDAWGDDYARIVHIKAAIAGQDGIKPDVFYVLNKNGEFVECD
ncbi:hypothetical protein [Pseudomonas sp. AAC]|uniref:DUF7666 domain-containing protein n=1 Tax=Pseudomonas sp. AAC TaxID=1502784 RepID=UPI0004D6DA97|nr:hypothetical protein [Pseudomonas sp. AAC]KES23118.1 hypothetical protein FG99_16300 [Pseudomonas sp. AAC]